MVMRIMWIIMWVIPIPIPRVPTPGIPVPAVPIPTIPVKRGRPIGVKSPRGPGWNEDNTAGSTGSTPSIFVIFKFKLIVELRSGCIRE